VNRRELVLLLGGVDDKRRATSGAEGGAVIGFLAYSPGAMHRTWPRSTGLERNRRIVDKPNGRIPLGGGVSMIGCPHWPPPVGPAKVYVIATSGACVTTAKEAHLDYLDRRSRPATLLLPGLYARLARPVGNLTGSSPLPVS